MTVKEALEGAGTRGDWWVAFPATMDICVDEQNANSTGTRPAVIQGRC